MASRLIKKEVMAILAAYPGPEADERLRALWREEDLIHPLFSSLCGVDEALRWRGIDVFGRVVCRLAARNMEAARVVMRRLLWSLNDESGGIGWGAPEAMAAVMAKSPALADEYLHMLVSYLKEDGAEPHQDGNFLELPLLQRGLLWGIGHVAPVWRQRLLAMGVAGEMEKYLSSPDKIVAGLALWCFTRLGLAATADSLKPLLDEQVIVPLFGDGDDDEIRFVTLGELARRVFSTPPPAVH
jgi:hypothetical protein